MDKALAPDLRILVELYWHTSCGSRGDVPYEFASGTGYGVGHDEPAAMDRAIALAARDPSHVRQFAGHAYTERLPLSLPDIGAARPRPEVPV